MRHLPLRSYYNAQQLMLCGSQGSVALLLSSPSASNPS